MSCIVLSCNIVSFATMVADAAFFFLIMLLYDTHGVPTRCVLRSYAWCGASCMRTCQVTDHARAQPLPDFWSVSTFS